MATNAIIERKGCRAAFLTTRGFRDVLALQRQLRPNDRLVIETAGGGGYGPPGERDSSLVAHDLHEGFITAEQASRFYRTDPDRKLKPALAKSEA